MTTFVMASLALLLAVALGMVISRGITNPLKGAVTVLRALPAGDLT